MPDSPLPTAYIVPDTTGDEYVVVMTLHSAVAAVGFAFIYIVFVAGLCVVLDIASFPKGVLLSIDNQCFGGSIHVESPTGGWFLSYAVGRGLSGIQVVVISGERGT